MANAEKIKQVKTIVKECKLEIVPIQKERNEIEALLARANSQLKTLKEKFKSFKSDCRHFRDSIETKIFNLIKLVYGVKIQAYHGVSLMGKETQKLMQNAGEIGSMFASILKENKKDDSNLPVQRLTSFAFNLRARTSCGTVCSSTQAQSIQMSNILNGTVGT